MVTSTAKYPKEIEKMLKPLTEVTRKCPNCNGTLSETEGGRIYVCDYCGAKFMEEGADEEEKPVAKAEETPKTEEKSEKKKDDKETGEGDFSDCPWFDSHTEYKTVARGKNSKKAFKNMLKCVTEFSTSEEIMKFIRSEMKQGSDVAGKGFDQARLDAIVKHSKKFLDNDEEPLFFSDDGLFSKGKHGTLITNKRTLIAGMKTRTLLHSDLTSMTLDNGSDIPYVYLNGEEGLQMKGPLGGNPGFLGSFAALVCALSFEQNPGREKIVLNYKRDDDDDDDDSDSDDEE